jgi:hypothetical protein
METPEEKKQSAKDKTDFTIPTFPNREKAKQQTPKYETPQTTEIIKRVSVFDHIVICINILLLILTGILAWANWNLARDSRKQVEFSEKNMVVANDPYFSVQPSFGAPSINNPVCDIYIKFKNVGKTPALNFKFVIVTQMRPADSIDTMTTIGGNFQNINILTPEDTLSLHRNITYTTDAIRDFYKGERLWVIDIVYQYEDIFKHCYWFTERLTAGADRENVFKVSNNSNKYKQLY